MASADHPLTAGPAGYTGWFLAGKAWYSRRSVWGIVISLGLLALAGCRAFDTSSRVVESVETDSNQRVERTLRGESIVSKQTPVRLRLPRSWQPVPHNKLHPTADIQAYNPQRKIYLIVLGEDQANVSAAGDLNRQAQIYVGLLKNSLTRVISAETLTGVDSVNGLDAVQYELQGEIFGAEAAYLHTTVELNDRYYQVVAWTPTERFNENYDEMQNIIQEFRSD